jgi:hypothetical protein
VGVPDSDLALRVGLQYDLFPVPLCTDHQGEGMHGSGVVGPRFAPAVAEDTWLTITVAARIGAGRTRGDAEVRSGCAGASGDAGLAVGEGLVSLGELGWRGFLLGVGPVAEIGLVKALPGGKTAIGFDVQIGYERLMPILPEAREVRFRTSNGIGKATVGPVAAGASFGRLVLAARAVVHFR